MPKALLSEITRSLVDCEGPDLTAKLSQRALEQGAEPLTIINQALVPGMEVVGEKFQTGEYFLPHMVIAANAMQQAMGLLEPELLERQQNVEGQGVFVIGSVKGDIHEIGKSLIATMMLASGFQVYDLGVDVAPEIFVEKIQETDADLVGLSALLTTTMMAQRDVLEALEEAGIRARVKVMVGGAPVTEEWAQSIGADGYAEDVVNAVELAKHLLS
ncbi:MAG: corrinoid protein [Anaerolineae bacterium]|jgi:corrinoid protein of di/trimethylamine methyltransferase